MLPHMGKLSRAVVSRNESGFWQGSSWYLDEVHVTDPDGHQFLFPCFDWVSAAVPYELTFCDKPSISYSIAVTTASSRGAGTDSNVFCTLCGSVAETAEMPLEKSNHRDKFERGATDVFLVRGKDLGQLRKAKKVV